MHPHRECHYRATGEEDHGENGGDRRQPSSGRPAAIGVGLAEAWRSSGVARPSARTDRERRQGGRTPRGRSRMRRDRRGVGASRLISAVRADEVVAVSTTSSTPRRSVYVPRRHRCRHRAWCSPPMSPAQPSRRLRLFRPDRSRRARWCTCRRTRHLRSAVAGAGRIRRQQGCPRATDRGVARRASRHRVHEPHRRGVRGRRRRVCDGFQHRLGLDAGRVLPAVDFPGLHARPTDAGRGSSRWSRSCRPKPRRRRPSLSPAARPQSASFVGRENSGEGNRGLIHLAVDDRSVIRPAA